MIDIVDLRNQLDGAKEHYKKVVQRMIEMDGKMQSRYDTQKEEYAREAETIELQVVALSEQLSSLENLALPTDVSIISVGHLVRISIDGDPSEEYLLVEKHSGIKIGELVTLSITTPIGRAIVGKKCGELVYISLHDEQVPVKIISINLPT